MTLAEAIRVSKETGCEFWRESSPLICYRYTEEIRRPLFSYEQAIADDWQAEQTAPHGEGM